MITPLPEGTLPTATRCLVLGVVGLGLLGTLAGGSPAHWVLWRDDPSVSTALLSVGVHASAEHLIYNALTLAACGSLVERRVGPCGLLAVALWAAIASAGAWLTLGVGAGLGGASGVAYGLLGASMVLCWGARVSVGASWPLALLPLVGLAGADASWLAVAGTLALACFLLPRRAQALLLRARLHVAWLSLPLLLQATQLATSTHSAHCGGFVAGAALGAALLLAPRLTAFAAAAPHTLPSPSA